MPNPSFHGVLDERALLGDKLQLLATGIGAAGAVVLGLQFVQAIFAILVALGLFAFAGATYVMARGTTASRLLLTTALVGMVILHIQLSKGMVEFHFGVFATLALVLVYLDWRPVVLAAGLFAIHHIVFDRLLAAGFGLYCLSEPDFSRIVLHALYVIVQTTLEIMLIAGLTRAAHEGTELQALVHHINQGDGIRLNTHNITTTTPLGQALQATLDRMQQAVNAVSESVSGIHSLSEEINSGNQELTNRTASTASGIEEVNATIEELTSSIKETAQSYHEAKRLAVTNAEAAQRGGSAVQQIVSTMEDIHHSSQQINDIIGVIDGIAFQTNILALNAAVEAARAGEQGRGFAVVASEVRTLAQRSAVAAKEIKVLIQASVEKVNTGTQLVEAAGNTIAEVVGNATKVSNLIETISRTTEEQSSEVEQINAAMNMLDSGVQRNATLAEDSLVVAGKLDEQANHLGEMVSAFKS